MTKGQLVKLTERGVRYHTPRSGAPRRQAPKIPWEGRTGVIGRVSTDRTRAYIIWDGNTSMSDLLPIKFLELVE